MVYNDFIALFDGVCDQTKELSTLYSFMSNDVKWIISSSGHYMFVRLSDLNPDLEFDLGQSDYSSSTGFSANIHYGNKNRTSRIF